MAGQIFAHITATAVRFINDEGDYDDRHGWIAGRDYPGDNVHDIDLYENRNDAAPAINSPEDDEDLADEVRELIGGYGTSLEDNGDGTFYLPDEYQPFESEWSYTFAVHFTRKGGASENWQESDWHPVEDGKIELEG